MKKGIILIPLALIALSGQQAFAWAAKKSTAATISDAKVRAQDSEGHIPFLELFSPVFYLHSKEPDYPISVEEYFTGPTTSVEYKKDGQFVSLIPKGEVTMEKIYDLWTRSLPTYTGDDKIEIPQMLHIYNSGNTLKGSNPTYYKNEAGILKTPVYVVTWEQEDKVYLQYITFFAENYGYGSLQLGYHAGDLEHVTIELDKKKLVSFMQQYQQESFKNKVDTEGMRVALGSSNPITQIYYGAHGDSDGYWMPGSHSHVGYSGTHPVVYIAKGGHGNYPRVGTYVRLLGEANDETDRGTRWEPEITRIFPETAPQFNVQEMGWMYFPGNLGWKSGTIMGATEIKGAREKTSVSPLWKKRWFMKKDVGMKNYTEYNGKRFCSRGKDYGSCVIKNSLKSIGSWLEE